MLNSCKKIDTIDAILKTEPVFFFLVYHDTSARSTHEKELFFPCIDPGYDRGGTPIFTGVFESLARVAL